MNFQLMHKQRKFILILAAVGAISVFLPWFSVSAEGLGVRISDSQSGFHGTGVLVFLAFIAAAILALAGDQRRTMDMAMWMAALCAGALALLFVIVNLARTPNSGDDLGFAHAGPGFGIWISLVAAGGTLAVAWLLRNTGDTLKGGFDSLKGNLASLSGPAPTTGPAARKPDNASRNGVETSSKIDDLERLIELKDQGKITDEEYQRLKSRLL